MSETLRGIWEDGTSGEAAGDADDQMRAAEEAGRDRSGHWSKPQAPIESSPS